MMRLFLPLARLRSKGLIEASLRLGHHFFFHGQPFFGTPIRHRAAFVQDLLGKAGAARPVAFKQIIEGRRRPPGGEEEPPAGRAGQPADGSRGA